MLSNDSVPTVTYSVWRLNMDEYCIWHLVKYGGHYVDRPTMAPDTESRLFQFSRESLEGVESVISIPNDG